MFVRNDIAFTKRVIFGGIAPKFLFIPTSVSMVGGVFFQIVIGFDAAVRFMNAQDSGTWRQRLLEER